MRTALHFYAMNMRKNAVPFIVEKLFSLFFLYKNEIFFKDFQRIVVPL
jgi:hypothetical protein